MASTITLIVLSAGFLVYMPISSSSSAAVGIVSTSTEVFPTLTTRVNSSIISTNVAQSIFQRSDVKLVPRGFDFSSSELNAGSSVKISWNASGQVDVFFFNSAQMLYFSSYGIPGGNLGSNNGINGTMNLLIQAHDTYSFVVANANDSPQSLVEYSSNGIEGQTVAGLTYSTQTTTYLTSSQSLITSMSNETTTTTCSHYFWTWLFGDRSCP